MLDEQMKRLKPGVFGLNRSLQVNSPRQVMFLAAFCIIGFWPINQKYLSCEKMKLQGLSGE
jgi:hypothetical protein